MAHQLTRLRLYAARKNAKFMGLPETAGRLKVLSKQLSRNRLSRQQERDRVIWARAKIEETQRHLIIEAKTNGAQIAAMMERRAAGFEDAQELDDSEHHAMVSYGMNRLGKMILWAGSFIAMADPIKRLFSQGASVLESVKPFAILSAAIVASVLIVDMFVSKNIDRCVYSVRDALEFSKRSIGKPCKELAKERG
ncbi:MAG: hypothetical protein V1827_02060 [Candidatus Micrarchaeota archaeon]